MAVDDHGDAGAEKGLIRRATKKLNVKNTGPDNDRFYWLDAMRGMAALAVMVYHARAILWIGLAETWKRHGFRPDMDAAIAYLLTPFSFGYLGVPLFFVISGFSIHYNSARRLAAAGEGATLPMKVFFLRRFFRLYPTYVAALATTAVIDGFLIARLPEVVGGDNHTITAFISTFLGLQGLVSPHFGSASVFWTLVLEMHLYLAYPLLFMLSKKRGPEFVLVLTLAVQLVTISLLAIFHVPERWPFWYAGGPVFFKFWFTWTVGMYAAECLAGRARGTWLSWQAGMLALIVGSVATFLRQESMAEIPLAVFFGWMLLHAARHGLFAGTTLRAAAFLGVLSYCLYSIHVPLLRLVRVFINAGRPSESIWPVFIGAFVSLAGAAALYFLVDRWSVSLSRSVGRTRQKSKGAL